MKGFHLLHQTSSFPRFILARRDVGVAGSNPVTPTNGTCMQRCPADHGSAVKLQMRYQVAAVGNGLQHD